MKKLLIAAAMPASAAIAADVITAVEVPWVPVARQLFLHMRLGYHKLGGSTVFNNEPRVGEIVFLKLVAALGRRKIPPSF